MKWEYNVLYYQNGRDPKYQGWNLDDDIVDAFKGLSVTEILDTLGEDGWELVSVLIREGDNDPHFYFKRMI